MQNRIKFIVRVGMSMNQGQLLKKIRVSRRLSQQQLAQNITSQAALSRMEKSGNIDANVLLRFLDKLDILKDGEQREKIISSGLENSKRFSWEKMGEEYVSLYKELLANKGQ